MTRPCPRTMHPWIERRPPAPAARGKAAPPCRPGGRPAPRAAVAAALAAALLAAASCDTETPLERLEQQLGRYPEYSVVLQDMSDEGFGHAHQYRVVVGERQDGSDELAFRESVLDWQDVDSETYERYRSSLGMVILSKGRDGAVDRDEHPPGYQQVGDERYGRWRDDGGGRSFWEFYGQYALLSNLIGGFGRSVYRDDWDGYRDARGRGQTYRGPRGGAQTGSAQTGGARTGGARTGGVRTGGVQTGGARTGGTPTYGTSGSTTRQTSPDFFRRQQARQAAQSQSFGQRVRSRMAGGARSYGK